MVSANWKVDFIYNYIQFYKIDTLWRVLCFQRCKGNDWKLFFFFCFLLSITACILSKEISKQKSIINLFNSCLIHDTMETIHKQKKQKQQQPRTALDINISYRRWLFESNCPYKGILVSNLHSILVLKLHKLHTTRLAFDNNNNNKKPD